MADQNKSYRIRLTRADGTQYIMGITLGGANQEGLTPAELIAYLERTGHFQHHDAEHVEILGPLDVDKQPGIADVVAKRVQYHIGERKAEPAPEDDNAVDELDQPVEVDPIPTRAPVKA